MLNKKYMVPTVAVLILATVGVLFAVRSEQAAKAVKQRDEQRYNDQMAFLKAEHEARVEEGRAGHVAAYNKLTKKEKENLQKEELRLKQIDVSEIIADHQAAKIRSSIARDVDRAIERGEVSPDERESAIRKNREGTMENSLSS